MTRKEQTRLQVLNSVLERQVTVDEAAQVLGMSVRHLWRVLAAYRREGVLVTTWSPNRENKNSKAG